MPFFILLINLSKTQKPQTYYRVRLQNFEAFSVVLTSFKLYYSY